MYHKDGFSQAGSFSDLWPAFCRAAAVFGAYAPTALRHDIDRLDVVRELVRASEEGHTRAMDEGSNGPLIAGFTVTLRGAAIAVKARWDAAALS